MRNKKSQSEIITTVLIILLVLAAVVIVWQIAQRIFGSNYNIEKIECQNITSQIGLECGFQYQINRQGDYIIKNFSKMVENPYESCYREGNVLMCGDRLSKGLEIANNECRDLIEEAHVNSIGLEYVETFSTFKKPVYENKEFCNRISVDELRIYGNVVNATSSQSACDVKLNQCFDNIEVIFNPTKKMLDNRIVEGKCLCLEATCSCGFGIGVCEKEKTWFNVAGGSCAARDYCVKYKCGGYEVSLK